MNSDKQIIVTGATGFIGSNLLHSLECRGYSNLVCVDTFGKDEKWKNVLTLNKTRFVSPDNLSEYISFNKNRIQAIIHLGGISSTTEDDVDLIVKTNISLSLELYEICKNNGYQFIYASSASTYGDGSNGFEDGYDIEYLSTLKPLNPYGWSKLYVDKYIANDLLNSKPTNQVVGLRFFNVYGPNENHKGPQASVMLKFYNEINNNKEIKLFRSHNIKFKDGMQERDFVYVKDCSDVITWMLENESICGLFNVGSGNARTFNDVANIIIKNLATDVSIVYIDMPYTLQKHYQYHTEANLNKLRKAGYIKEMTSLEDGISNYINEYLINKK